MHRASVMASNRADHSMGLGLIDRSPSPFHNAQNFNGVVDFGEL